MNDTRPEPIFADGLIFQKPREGAPDYVKGSISVNVAKFVEFLRTQRAAGNISAKGWLSLDLKKSKNGTLYFQVNTYKSPETKSVEGIKEQIGQNLSYRTGELSEEERRVLAQHRDSHNRQVDESEIRAEDIPFD